MVVVYEMSEDSFADEVQHVLAGLPPELSEQIANVGFEVQDGDDPNLLGLYRGVSLDRRGQFYAGAMPDLITIYRRPILARCTSVQDVRDRVEVTVKHEIGHYFGIDDDRLHELGWG